MNTIPIEDALDLSISYLNEIKLADRLVLFPTFPILMMPIDQIDYIPDLMRELGRHMGRSFCFGDVVFVELSSGHRIITITPSTPKTDSEGQVYTLTESGGQLVCGEYIGVSSGTYSDVYTHFWSGLYVHFLECHN